MRKFVLCLLALVMCAYSALAANYYTEVDKTNQIVTIFKIENGDIGGIARQMICSTGEDTPDGVFIMPFDQKETDRSEWYYTMNRYVKWPVRILGGFLFHSLPYMKKDDNAIDTEALSQMGTPASHGCVRLYADDAKWIADNLGTGDIVNFITTGEDRSALKEKLKLVSYTGDADYSEFLGDGVYTYPQNVASILTEIAGKIYGVVYITRQEILNIRKKKDFESDLAGYVPVGSVVEVLEVDGRWSRIKFYEYEGWISTAYLKKLED